MPIEALLTDLFGQSEPTQNTNSVTANRPEKPAAGKTAAPLKKSSLAILQRKTEEALARSSLQALGVQSVLQLTFDKWDDDRRGVPNPLIRSGLFTTRLSKTRFNYKAEKIASLSNIDILYTGEELRQDDFTVWMALTHKAREKPLGNHVYFTGYELIKDMAWRMHSESYAKLRASIARLKLTAIQITSKNERSGYTGSLIRDYAFDSEDEIGNTRYMVRFEPAIANLFKFDETTLIEWSQRVQIGSRASLTLWLHMFLFTHSTPIPYSVSKFHEQCKSEEKTLRTFKVRLQRSLETLIEIGFLQSYAIIKDMVHVKRAFIPRQLSA